MDVGSEAIRISSLRPRFWFPFRSECDHGPFFVLPSKTHAMFDNFFCFTHFPQSGLWRKAKIPFVLGLGRTFPSGLPCENKPVLPKDGRQLPWSGCSVISYTATRIRANYHRALCASKETTYKRGNRNAVFPTGQSGEGLLEPYFPLGSLSNRTVLGNVMNPKKGGNGQKCPSCFFGPKPCCGNCFVEICLFRRNVAAILYLKRLPGMRQF